ncbi:MAG: hypothetical protein INR71_05125 [Terriglobus roseus]|nr:hypothetical protein [Terriglobus roseus]
MGNYIAISKYPFQRDPGLAGALITIWQEIEVSYSLAAVTISASKAFADAFMTGFGWGDTFREHGQSQYMLESAASRSRTAPSRGGGRDGIALGTGHGTITSQTPMSDRKNISPMATAADDEDGPYRLQGGSAEHGVTREVFTPNGRYHNNDYSLGAGRPRTQGSDTSRSNGNGRAVSGGGWRSHKKEVTVSSEYVDPLDGVDDGDDEGPLRLRPERKLRNTAIIEHDPSVSAFQHHRRPGHSGDGSVESDDMFIVRNVDYSIRYDQAPTPGQK